MPRTLGAEQIPTVKKDVLTALAEVPGNSIRQAASEADMKPGKARKIVAEAHQRPDGQGFVTREPTLPHIAMAQTPRSVAPLRPTAGNASRTTTGHLKETPKADVATKKRPRSPSPEPRALPIVPLSSGIFAHEKTTQDAEDDDDDENEDLLITDNCDVVRRKINALINSGEMKVTHFQRACGITAGSYGGFMKQKGPYAGINNRTYDAAFKFFKSREEKGIKIPPTSNKKQKVNGGGEKSGAIGVEELKKVHLDSEENEQVEIYDTCDEVRRKIAAHLRRPGVTGAGFCRNICAVAYPNESKAISGSQLKSFQTKKGPNEGNSSAVFYGAYVYFEKLRIKEGKKKSKKREQMEEAWGNLCGFSRELNQGGYWCAAGEKPVMDRLGKVTFMRG
ncbi:hypothetical protein LPUS_11936 [Lasallia pustulata]|uniref:DUF7726 domain-containing protein n=1 Tax=Lasallia pustulata TaxID=136370 RepID=A0A1W5DDW6_9LECA|nr:hypothetical protein LPUS_11936 [Lasallia pustulata]